MLLGQALLAQFILMGHVGQRPIRQIVQVVQVVLQALLNIIVQLETGNVDAEQQLHLQTLGMPLHPIMTMTQLPQPKYHVLVQRLALV